MVSRYGERLAIADRMPAPVRRLERRDTLRSATGGYPLNHHPFALASYWPKMEACLFPDTAASAWADQRHVERLALAGRD